MARDYVEIKSFDGVTTAISKEDRKIELLQTLINLRHGKILGRAVKRGGYSSILSSGLTTLKRMIEFKNKNASTLLMVMDGNTLKESVYSGGYGAIGAIANDERTASSTIDGDNFNPIIVNKEMRSGAGISASTQRPVWYGYIAERDRFNAAITISADKYLTNQYYALSLGFPSITSFDVIASSVSGEGLAAGNYMFYISPILDGYQKGFPYAVTTNPVPVTSDDSAIRFAFGFSAAEGAAYHRITGFDIFVAPMTTQLIKNFSSFPAYFLTRVDLNNDSDIFFSITGNVGVTTANKIVIDSISTWKTFNTVGQFIRANGSYYRITAEALDTPGAGQVELTVTPNAAAVGDTTCDFLARWFLDSYYLFEIIYDDYYHKLGSEMYAYLNIPIGDEGIPDFRYKYSAYNGNRVVYTGFPTDTNFSYYSANEAPDVVPSRNIFRHKFDTRGVVNVGRDFFVFTDRGIERLNIYGNQQTEQDDDFSNSILAHTKSIAKISDALIAFMSYNGPRIIAGREEIPIGETLSQWWNETLTQAQKEACVAGYNFLHEELYFSFPTYTTSPYTNGIVFVFDMKAWRNDYISPWWIFSCDTPIYSFEGPNLLQHLLAGGLTKIIDIDGGGAESFATSYKMKLMQNPVPGKKVWWDRVYADVETSDTVTANLYFDGSASAVALSLNSDLNGFIRYMKETFELELATAASTNTVEHKGMLLSFTPRSK